MPIRICCATWNVNSKEPGQESLESWLCTSPDAPDIVAVTLQEIVELSDVSQYIGINRGRESESMAFSWSRLLRSTLMSHERYRGTEFTVLEYHKLVGTMLCVIVQTKLLGQISAVYSGNASTGLMGLANKGACAIRFNLHSTGANRTKRNSICFVGCHLAAHSKEIEKRNADVATILHSTVFDANYPDDPDARVRRSSQPHSVYDSSSQKSGDSGRLLERTSKSMAHGVPLNQQFQEGNWARNNGSILNHDIIFWAGDLNYRLEGIGPQVALSKLQQRNFAELLASDQLTREKAHGRVFAGFQEGPISFAPTYKFIAGSDRYDCTVPKPGEELKTKHAKGQVQGIGQKLGKRVARFARLRTRDDEEYDGRKPTKVRVPAWCDRVLWKSDQNIQQLSYSMSMAQKGSDHKPVSAQFTLPFLDALPSTQRRHDFLPKPQTIEESLSEENDNSGNNLNRYPTAAPGQLSGNNPYLRAIPEEVECACVTIPYDPRGPDDLTLRVGDLVEVLSGTTKDGMAVGWTARSGNKVGFFPVSHVRTMGLYRADPKTGLMQEAASKALALRHARIQAELQGASAGVEVNHHNYASQGFPLFAKAASAFALMQKLMNSARNTVTANRLGGGMSATAALLFGVDESNEPIEMQARYTYNANADDELSFRKGDILTVVSMVSVEHGWWVAHLNEKQGLVPANYFQPVGEVDDDDDSDLTDDEEAIESFDESI